MGVEGQTWHDACRCKGSLPHKDVRARKTYLCSTKNPYWLTQTHTHTHTPTRTHTHTHKHTSTHTHTHIHTRLLSENTRNTTDTGLQACAQPSTEAATVAGQIWEWKARHGTARADAQERGRANTCELEKHTCVTPHPYWLTQTHKHTHTHTCSCCKKSNAQP